MQNTDRLGISSQDLTRDLGLTWVLHRQTVRSASWPALGDRVTIVTLPTRIERSLITYRDFYLLDDQGGVLACSSSTWSLMDLENRRIRPIPKQVIATLGDLPSGNAKLESPPTKPTPPENPVSERNFRVQFSHLDFNNHLTNPTFPELMLEPLDLPFLGSHLPIMADMVYHREARYGDFLTAVSAPTDTAGQFNHALYRNEHELLASMVTRWSPAV